MTPQGPTNDKKKPTAPGARPGAPSRTNAGPRTQKVTDSLESSTGSGSFQRPSSADSDISEGSFASVPSVVSESSHTPAPPIGSRPSGTRQGTSGGENKGARNAPLAAAAGVVTDNTHEKKPAFNISKQDDTKSTVNVATLFREQTSRENEKKAAERAAREAEKAAEAEKAQSLENSSSSSSISSESSADSTNTAESFGYTPKAPVSSKSFGSFPGRDKGAASAEDPFFARGTVSSNAAAVAVTTSKEGVHVAHEPLGSRSSLKQVFQGGGRRTAPNANTEDPNFISTVVQRPSTAGQTPDPTSSNFSNPPVKAQKVDGNQPSGQAGTTNLPPSPVRKSRLANNLAKAKEHDLHLPFVNNTEAAENINASAIPRSSESLQLLEIKDTSQKTETNTATASSISGRRDAVPSLPLNFGASQDSSIRSNRSALDAKPIAVAPKSPEKLIVRTVHPVNSAAPEVSVTRKNPVPPLKDSSSQGSRTLPGSSTTKKERLVNQAPAGAASAQEQQNQDSVNVASTSAKASSVEPMTPQGEKKGRPQYSKNASLMLDLNTHNNMPKVGQTTDGSSPRPIFGQGDAYGSPRAKTPLTLRAAGENSLIEGSLSQRAEKEANQFFPGVGEGAQNANPMEYGSNKSFSTRTNDLKLNSFFDPLMSPQSPDKAKEQPTPTNVKNVLEHLGGRNFEVNTENSATNAHSRLLSSREANILSNTPVKGPQSSRASAHMECNKYLVENQEIHAAYETLKNSIKELDAKNEKLKDLGIHAVFQLEGFTETELEESVQMLVSQQQNTEDEITFILLDTLEEYQKNCNEKIIQAEAEIERINNPVRRENFNDAGVIHQKAGTSANLSEKFNQADSNASAAGNSSIEQGNSNNLTSQFEAAVSNQLTPMTTTTSTIMYSPRKNTLAGTSEFHPKAATVTGVPTTPLNNSPVRGRRAISPQRARLDGDSNKTPLNPQSRPQSASRSALRPRGPSVLFPNGAEGSSKIVMSAGAYLSQLGSIENDTSKSESELILVPYTTPNSFSLNEQDKEVERTLRATKKKDSDTDPRYEIAQEGYLLSKDPLTNRSFKNDLGITVQDMWIQILERLQIFADTKSYNEDECKSIREYLLSDMKDLFNVASTRYNAGNVNRIKRLLPENENDFELFVQTSSKTSLMHEFIIKYCKMRQQDFKDNLMEVNSYLIPTMNEISAFAFAAPEPFDLYFWKKDGGFNVIQLDSNFVNGQHSYTDRKVTNRCDLLLDAIPENIRRIKFNYGDSDEGVNKLNRLKKEHVLRVPMIGELARKETLSKLVSPREQDLSNATGSSLDSTTAYLEQVDQFLNAGPINNARSKAAFAAPAFNTDEYDRYVAQHEIAKKAWKKLKVLREQLHEKQKQLNNLGGSPIPSAIQDDPTIEEDLTIIQDRLEEFRLKSLTWTTDEKSDLLTLISSLQEQCQQNQIISQTEIATTEAAIQELEKPKYEINENLKRNKDVAKEKSAYRETMLWHIAELDSLSKIAKEYSEEIQGFYTERGTLFYKIGLLPKNERIKISLDITLQNQTQELASTLENSTLNLSSLNNDNVFEKQFRKKETRVQFFDSLNEQSKAYYSSVDSIHAKLEEAQESLKKATIEVERKIKENSTRSEREKDVKNLKDDAADFGRKVFEQNNPLETLQNNIKNWASSEERRVKSKPCRDSLDDVTTIFTRLIAEKSLIERKDFSEATTADLEKWLKQNSMSLENFKKQFEEAIALIEKTRADFNIGKTEQETQEDEQAKQSEESKRIQRENEQEKLQIKFNKFTIDSDKVSAELTAEIVQLQKVQEKLLSLKPEDESHSKEISAFKAEIERAINKIQDFISTDIPVHTRTITQSITVSNFDTGQANFFAESDKHYILRQKILEKIRGLENRISEAARAKALLDQKIAEVLAEAVSDVQQFFDAFKQISNALKSIQSVELRHIEPKLALEAIRIQIEKRIKHIDDVVIPGYRDEASQLLTIEMVDQFAVGFNTLIKNEMATRLQSFASRVQKFEADVKNAKNEKDTRTIENKEVIDSIVADFDKLLQTVNVEQEKVNTLEAGYTQIISILTADNVDFVGVTSDIITQKRKDLNDIWVKEINLIQRNLANKVKELRAIPLEEEFGHGSLELYEEIVDENSDITKTLAEAKIQLIALEAEFNEVQKNVAEQLNDALKRQEMAPKEQDLKLQVTSLYNEIEEKTAELSALRQQINLFCQQKYSDKQGKPRIPPLCPEGAWINTISDVINQCNTIQSRLQAINEWDIKQSAPEDLNQEFLNHQQQFLIQKELFPKTLELLGRIEEDFNMAESEQAKVVNDSEERINAIADIQARREKAEALAEAEKKARLLEKQEQEKQKVLEAKDSAEKTAEILALQARLEEQARRQEAEKARAEDLQKQMEHLRQDVALVKTDAEKTRESMLTQLNTAMQETQEEAAKAIENATEVATKAEEKATVAETEAATAKAARDEALKEAELAQLALEDAKKLVESAKADVLQAKNESVEEKTKAAHALSKAQEAEKELTEAADAARTREAELEQAVTAANTEVTKSLQVAQDAKAKVADLEVQLEQQQEQFKKELSVVEQTYAEKLQQKTNEHAASLEELQDKAGRERQEHVTEKAKLTADFESTLNDVRLDADTKVVDAQAQIKAIQESAEKAINLAGAISDAAQEKASELAKKLEQALEKNNATEIEKLAVEAKVTAALENVAQVTLALKEAEKESKDKTLLAVINKLDSHNKKTTLKAGFDSWKNKIQNEKQHEIDAQQEKVVQELREKLKGAEEESEAVQVKLTELNAAQEQQLSEIKTLTEAQKGAQEQFEIKNTQLTTVIEEQKTALENATLKLKETAEKLDEEREESVKEIDALKEKINLSQVTGDEQTTEFQRQLQSAEDREKNIVKKNAQLEEALGEVNDLRQELSAKLETTIAEAAAQKAAFELKQTEIADLQKTHAQELGRTRDEAQATVEQVRAENEHKIADIAAARDLATEKTQDLEQQLDEVSKENNAIRAQKQVAEDQAAATESKLQMATQELEGAQNTLALKTAQAEEKLKAHEQSENDIRALKEQIKLSQAEGDGQTTEFQRQLQLAEEKQKELAEKNAQLEQTIEEAGEFNEKLEGELELASSENAKAKAQLAILEEAQNQAQEKIDALTLASQAAEEKTQVLNEQYREELTNVAQANQALLTELEKTQATLKQQGEESKNKIVQLEQQIKQSQADEEGKVAILRAELEEAKKLEEATTNRMNETQQLLAEKFASQAALSAQLETVEVELARQKQEAEESQSSYEQEKEVLSYDLVRVKAERNQLKTELKKINQALGEETQISSEKGLSSGEKKFEWLISGQMNKRNKAAIDDSLNTSSVAQDTLLRHDEEFSGSEEASFALSDQENIVEELVSPLRSSNLKKSAAGALNSELDVTAKIKALQKQKRDLESKLKEQEDLEIDLAQQLKKATERAERAEQFAMGSEAGRSREANKANDVLAQLTQERDASEEKIAELEKTVTAIAESENQGSVYAAQLSKELDEERAKQVQIEQVMAQMRESLDAANSDNAQLAEQLTTISKERDANAAEAVRVAAELDNAGNALFEALAKAHDKEQQVSALEDALGHVRNQSQEEKAALTAELEAQKQQAEAAQQAVEAAKANVDAIQAQAAALEEENARVKAEMAMVRSAVEAEMTEKLAGQMKAFDDSLGNELAEKTKLNKRLAELEDELKDIREAEEERQAAEEQEESNVDDIDLSEIGSDHEDDSESEKEVQSRSASLTNLHKGSVVGQMRTPKTQTTPQARGAAVLPGANYFSDAGSLHSLSEKFDSINIGSTNREADLKAKKEQARVDAQETLRTLEEEKAQVVAELEKKGQVEATLRAKLEMITVRVEQLSMAVEDSEGRAAQALAQKDNELASLARAAREDVERLQTEKDEKVAQLTQEFEVKKQALVESTEQALMEANATAVVTRTIRGAIAGKKLKAAETAKEQAIADAKEKFGELTETFETEKEALEAQTEQMIQNVKNVAFSEIENGKKEGQTALALVEKKLENLQQLLDEEQAAMGEVKNKNNLIPGLQENIAQLKQILQQQSEGFAEVAQEWAARIRTAEVAENRASENLTEAESKVAELEKAIAVNQEEKSQSKKDNSTLPKELNALEEQAAIASEEALSARAELSTAKAALAEVESQRDAEVQKNLATQVAVPFVSQVLQQAVADRVTKKKAEDNKLENKNAVASVLEGMIQNVEQTVAAEQWQKNLADHALQQIQMAQATANHQIAEANEKAKAAELKAQQAQQALVEMQAKLTNKSDSVLPLPPQAATADKNQHKAAILAKNKAITANRKFEEEQAKRMAAEQANAELQKKLNALKNVAGQTKEMGVNTDTEEDNIVDSAVFESFDDTLLLQALEVLVRDNSQKVSTTSAAASVVEQADLQLPPVPTGTLRPPAVTKTSTSGSMIMTAQRDNKDDEDDNDELHVLQGGAPSLNGTVDFQIALAIEQVKADTQAEIEQLRRDLAAAKAAAAAQVEAARVAAEELATQKAIAGAAVLAQQVAEQAQQQAAVAAEQARVAAQEESARQLAELHALNQQLRDQLAAQIAAAEQARVQAEAAQAAAVQQAAEQQRELLAENARLSLVNASLTARLMSKFIGLFGSTANAAATSAQTTTTAQTGTIAQTSLTATDVLTAFDEAVLKEMAKINLEGEMTEESLNFKREDGNVLPTKSGSLTRTLLRGGAKMEKALGGALPFDEYRIKLMKGLSTKLSLDSNLSHIIKSQCDEVADLFATIDETQQLLEDTKKTLDAAWVVLSGWDAAAIKSDNEGYYKKYKETQKKYDIASKAWEERYGKLRDLNELDGETNRYNQKPDAVRNARNKEELKAGKEVWKQKLLNEVELLNFDQGTDRVVAEPKSFAEWVNRVNLQAILLKEFNIVVRFDNKKEEVYEMDKKAFLRKDKKALDDINAEIIVDRADKATQGNHPKAYAILPVAEGRVRVTPKSLEESPDEIYAFVAKTRDGVYITPYEPVAKNAIVNSARDTALAQAKAQAALLSIKTLMHDYFAANHDWPTKNRQVEIRPRNKTELHHLLGALLSLEIPLDAVYVNDSSYIDDEKKYGGAITGLYGSKKKSGISETVETFVGDLTRKDTNNPKKANSVVKTKEELQRLLEEIRKYNVDRKNELSSTRETARRQIYDPTKFRGRTQ